MKTLKLDSSSITNISLQSIGSNLSQLEVLVLDYCKSITEEGLKFLQSLKKLKELNLTCKSVPMKIPRPIHFSYK